MNSRMIETRPGIKVRVFEAGSGAPLVFFHGAGGLFGHDPFLDRLAEKYQCLHLSCQAMVSRVARNC